MPNGREQYTALLYTERYHDMRHVKWYSSGLVTGNLTRRPSNWCNGGSRWLVYVAHARSGRLIRPLLAFATNCQFERLTGIPAKYDSPLQLAVALMSCNSGWRTYLLMQGVAGEAGHFLYGRRALSSRGCREFRQSKTTGSRFGKLLW